MRRLFIKVIEYCSDCGHCRDVTPAAARVSGLYSDHVCDKTKRKDRTLPGGHFMPEWCPLPKAKDFALKPKEEACRATNG